MKIVQLAKLLGVSPMTVSRVAGGKPGVHPKTRARVQKLIEEKGYVHHQSARMLRGEPSRVVGLVLNELGHGFFEPFVDRLSFEMSARGLRLEIAFAGYSIERVRSFLRTISAERALGAILAEIDEADMESLGDLPYLSNTLFLQAPQRRPQEKVPYNFVGIDDTKAAQLAAQTLWDAGHRRILYLYPPRRFFTQRTVSHRCQFFQKFYSESKKKGEVALFEIKPGSLEISTPDLIRAISSHKATALACENDFVALRASQALFRGGVQIPKDLSLISFDDTFFSAFMSPALSTIRLPYEAASGEIADFFLASLEGKPILQMVMDPILVERDSIAPRHALKGY